MLDAVADVTNERRVPVAAAPRARSPRPFARLVPALERRAATAGFPVLLAVAIAVAIAGQLVEDLVDDPVIQMVSPTASIARWTVIVLTVYMLLIVRRVDAVVERSHGAMARVSELEERELERHEDGMRRLDARVDLALLALAAAIVTILFAILRYPLPVTDHPVTGARLSLPDTIAAVPIIAGYVVTGWAGIRLVYATIRRAVVLGRLARAPMRVDVFDITDLLPFGQIALAISLGPAGVIVILLLGLGQPGGALAWSVLFLASLSAVLALLLPLRGVHAQMDRARDSALAHLNHQLRQIHHETTDAGTVDEATLGRLNHRTSILIQLRKVVGEMTTWPFQDTAALARAFLVVSAPLIYATLTELIKLYLIDPRR